MKKNIGILLVLCLFCSPASPLLPQDTQEVLELEIMKTPTYREVGGFWYVYLDFTCTRSGMGEKSRFFSEECRKQGIESDWIFLVFYNWSEEKDAAIKWTRALVVPGDTKVTAPLKLAKLEKFKAMAYTYTGPLEIPKIAESNKFLSQYIKDQGLKELWPNYEIIRREPPQVHLWYLVEGKPDSPSKAW